MIRSSLRHFNPWAMSAAAIALSLVVSSCTDSQEGVPKTDLIFTNAKIYTLDTTKPWAEAVALSGGTILAVGDEVDVLEFSDRGTRIVDLEGRLLMPAFGDAHAHPVFGGISFSRCSLHAGKSLEDYQRIIAGCVEDSPGDATVFGVGWEDSLFPPNGVPRKEVLDAVSKDRVLIFNSVGGHTYWVNSKALEVAGIDATTPDPIHGTIDRDSLTGEPVGGLQESARDLVSHLVPQPSDKEMQDAILYVVELFNRLGITGWHDAGIALSQDGKSEILDAYKSVFDRGELTAHVTIAFTWDNARGVEQVSVLKDAADRAESWGLTANTVKFYADGVIPQRTAAMLKRYEGSGNLKGFLQIPPDTLRSAIAQIQSLGLQAHVHAIGDRSTRVALDVFQSVKEESGAINRPMISHLNVIDPADQRRFGPIGAIAVFQPTWSSNYPYMDLTKKAIGSFRSENIYPAAGVIRSGGMIAYGADWPVDTADPLLGLEVAVTRINHAMPDSAPLLPEQALTLEQAVKSHTIDVAYANHLEDITGSVEVGKSADLIVLDQNIFEMQPADISNATVLLTLFRGEPVFGDIDQFSD